MYMMYVISPPPPYVYELSRQVVSFYFTPFFRDIMQSSDKTLDNQENGANKGGNAHLVSSSG